MAEEAVEEIVDETPPAEETAGEDKASEEGQEASEESASKETKTLLSDDEGDGSDDKEPVEYEFKAPEGFEISEEAQSQIDAFKAKAGELKLSPEQFQGLVEYQTTIGREVMAEQASAYHERIVQWGKEVEADKELGGENLQSNLATIKGVTEAFGDDSVMALMKAPSPDNPEGLGLGNHPAMLRFLHRIGTSLSDSKFVEGDGHKSSDSDGLKRMYPSMYNA